MKIRSIFHRTINGIWRHKYVWTIILFLVFVGFVDENSFWNRYKLVADNEETTTEIEQYEKRYERDQTKLRQLKSDPQALIRVAREEHQMKSPDEDVYYITHSDSAATE